MDFQRLIRVLLSGGLVVGLSVIACAAVADRPNILLLVAEDMSSRVGAFGDAVARTPNIDRLAREGVRFTQVFTTAGVCAPSRAALITGLHQESIGAQHMRSSTSPRARYRAVPPTSVKAFPELLRAAGYFTFTDRKLDYQFSGIGAGTGPATIWDAEGEEADWRGREPSQPFFGMVNFYSTHESALFDIGPQLADGSWGGAMVAGLRTWQRFRLPDRTDPDAVEVPPYYPDTPEVRAGIARHYDNIRVMDGEVGALLAKLRADGLADNTIVIWTTDHGDALPRSKRELFDSGIHVPLIVRWPESWTTPFVAGDVDNRLVSFVDLAPTILTMAGVAAPEHLHGVDFLNGPRRAYVYAARDRIDERDDRLRAVRDHRYKYIRNFYEGAPGAVHIRYRDFQPVMRALWQALEQEMLNDAAAQWFAPRSDEALFDVQRDPFELRNLAAQPGFESELERFRRALASRPHSDLSDAAEIDMAERFWPGGIEPITAAVRFEPLEDGRLALSSPTEGASIAYRFEAGRWHLYTQPLTQQPGLEAKAVRYGWRESEVSKYDGELQQGEHDGL